MRATEPAADDEHRLEEQISFRRLLACVPRWVLATRTQFSSFLARSFHVSRKGSSLPSAVYPLPIPQVGIFASQRIPKLSKRRWLSLCMRRALHVIVMALNYLHNDCQPVPMAKLGRRPNLVQMRVFQRLRALLTACDAPGEFPMPPGRSGFEFIARLVELEHFAASHSEFHPDAYSSEVVHSTCAEKVGSIGEGDAFRVSSEFSPIRPYRSLIASRLKLSGTGAWPMHDYLEDILWLPFLEPAILRHELPVTWSGPDFSRESKDECLQLVKIWDAKGLLALFHKPPPGELFCRVFNAHKSSQIDRQIGDRRWTNGQERHPRGPSASLPSGSLMTSLHCRRGHTLVGCASDRKDFYHQAMASRERAHTNVLPFSYDVMNFEGTEALKVLLDEVGQKTSRAVHGDRYGMQRRSVLTKGEITNVYPGFKSLFQGDHLGVEFALSSHTTLLQSGGLLDDSSIILRHQPFPRGPVWEALVIDDYVVVSREKAGFCPGEAKSVIALEKAEEVYRESKVFGSDEKTVRGDERFKVIGAEIASDKRTRGAGVITVAAPLSKRVPMIALSMKIAAMPVVSRALASRLAGNWVSILMYRRVLSCVLGDIFSLGTTSEKDGGDVVKLSRKIAEELCLAGVFGLVAATDVTAEYDHSVYATDASLSAGAFCEKSVPGYLSEILWLGGDKKGCYTKLVSGPREVLRGLGEDPEDSSREDESDPPEIPKVLDFCFDCVEICGGSGVLSAALVQLGLQVCPPIDISSSKHFDLENVRLLDWILQMIKEKRFKSVVVEPPCTTFSPAQHPASRSYSQPLGFNRKDPKTLRGNVLAFRCMTICWVAWRYLIPALLEQPRLSKMAWLKFWKYLIEIGFLEAIVASCRFGSPHRKEFRFLGFGIEMAGLEARCSGGHPHVRIEGALTKASAVYTQQLAEHLAKFIKKAVFSSKVEEFHFKGSANESLVVNDILYGDGWLVSKAWSWRRPGHINILESNSYVSLLRELCLRGGDRRFVALMDSKVAKGAHAKGRSSSLGLRASLRRGCAYTIAGNLHPSHGFAPTRLNVSDAPTRFRLLPEPAKLSILDMLDSGDVARLHSFQFSRVAAGWLRLAILLAFCSGPVESAGDTAVSWSGFLPHAMSWFGFDTSSFTNFLWNAEWNFRSSELDSVFMSLIGVPCLYGLGFGLLVGLSSLGLFSLLSRLRWTVCVALVVLVRSGFGYPSSKRPLSIRSHCLFLCWVGARAMPLCPAGADETKRAQRRADAVLQADRVVKQKTRDHRETLLQAFDRWLREHLGSALDELLDQGRDNPEAVSDALVAFGKEMFYAGKSYGRFSETINAVASRRPFLRRQLASAWDLAFNWVVDEPHEHHPALPKSILIAMTGLALLWGWSVEAALISLGWSGILRVGELLAAKRSDLVLPCDAAPGVNYIILKIQLPKTRGRAARHQSSRVDYVDIVQLVSAIFRGFEPHQPLWHLSPATLRKRFNALQSALGLQLKRENGHVPYDMASLRAGGATFMLQCTEDAELVRRRGRWLTTKVLEVYLQEASVSTFTTRLSPETTSRISDLCFYFPSILQRAIFFKRTQVPEAIWPKLW